MRIVFLGCVDFSRALYERTLGLPDVQVVGVVTRATSAFHSDFCSLAPLAGAAGIPVFLDSANRQQEMAAWIRQRAPDVIYCFGWPYLLQASVLAVPSKGVIGYHPTALPRNRGRHPIIWTLVLGLTETCSSFFIMDEGADSGDLVSQTTVPVFATDSATSLYERLKAAALNQLPELTAALVGGQVRRIRQDSSRATYWRKRGKEDGRIDWRMPSPGIYNLVRALARPYPGAHCVVSGREVKIWRTEFPSPAQWPEATVQHREPGRVLAVRANTFDIRCGVGVLRIVEHEFETVPAVDTCL